MIKGMDTETARRYVKVMKEIEKIADGIHGIAYLLSIFLNIEEGAIEIKPSTVGYFGEVIADEVLRIIESLDDHFASMAEVELELDALKNDE